MFAIVVMATSCKKERDEHQGIFKGPAVKVHGGKAWTWVQLNSEGAPQKISITVDDAALNTVAGSGGHGGGEHAMDDNFVLAFHPKAEAILRNFTSSA